MKLDNLSAFTKHLQGAFPSHLLPVYMILSKDQDLLQEGVRLFKEVVLEKGSSFDYTSISLGGQQLSSLFEELNTRSFFASKRLLYASNVEKLKKEDVQALASLLSKKEPAATLLLSGSSDPKLKQLLSAVEKEGMVLSLAELKSWQKEKLLAEWLVEQAAKQRKRLEKGVAEELLLHTGQDRGSLLQELEKLIIYVDKSPVITLKDMRSLSGTATVESIWELFDTLFAKNCAQALKSLHSLLDEGLEPISFIRQLRSQVQTYFALRDLLERKASEQEIGELLPRMQGFVLKKSKEKACRFSCQSFRNMLLLVDEADLLLRTNIPNTSALLDKLIVTICQFP